MRWFASGAGRAKKGGYRKSVQKIDGRNLPFIANELYNLDEELNESKNIATAQIRQRCDDVRDTRSNQNEGKSRK